MSPPTDPLDTVATLRAEWERDYVGIFTDAQTCEEYIERLLAALDAAERIEVCPVCGKVAHYGCECGEEWYDRKQSMARTNQRLAPEVRALKAQVARLRAALEASDDLITDADGRGYLTPEAAKRQHERNAAVLTDTEPQP